MGSRHDARNPVFIDVWFSGTRSNLAYTEPASVRKVIVGQASLRA